MVPRLEEKVKVMLKYTGAQTLPQSILLPALKMDGHQKPPSHGSGAPVPTLDSLWLISSIILGLQISTSPSQKAKGKAKGVEQTATSLVGSPHYTLPASDLRAVTVLGLDPTPL